MAFLAMGGDEAKQDAIDSQKLISIVKDEFKLTIDIEVKYILKRLIQEIDLDGTNAIVPFLSLGILRVQKPAQ